MVNIVKDKKGPCYIVSHQRCGMTENIFLTMDELQEIAKFVHKTDH